VPTKLPTITAATTIASHANVAVFQCAALQRPARYAMFIAPFLSFADNTRARVARITRLAYAGGGRSRVQLPGVSAGQPAGLARRIG
jgi:hypothetical protein